MLKHNSIISIIGEEYRVIGGVECEDIDDNSLFVQYFLKKLKTEEKYLLRPEKDEYILYFEVDGFDKIDEQQKENVIKNHKVTIYFGEADVEIGEQQKCFQFVNENDIYKLVIEGKKKKYYFGSKIKIDDKVKEEKKIEEKNKEENIEDTEKNNVIQDVMRKTQEKIKNAKGKVSDTLKKDEVQEVKKKIKEIVKNIFKEKDVRLTKKPINITEIYVTILLILIFVILIMIAMNEYKKMF